MFDVGTFFQVFYLVFLIVIAVGPGFLTTANIAMSYGYKKGAFAILGCWTVDIVYITLGAIALQTVIAILPVKAMSYFSGVSGLFLIFLAYTFWNVNTNKITAIKASNNNWSIYLTMICLGFSSPIAIIGYSAIFSTIIDAEVSTIVKLLGGYCGALVGHSCVVLLFASIGRKIKTNFLVIMNRMFAILIAIFACTLLFHFASLVYMNINNYFLKH